MKRSFDGIHVGYLAPIKKNAPADYQKILDWFRSSRRRIDGT